MLAPKKVKFRKMQKGRMTGKAYRGVVVEKAFSNSLSRGADYTRGVWSEGTGTRVGHQPTN